MQLKNKNTQHSLECINKALARINKSQREERRGEEGRGKTYNNAIRDNQIEGHRLFLSLKPTLRQQQNVQAQGTPSYI